MYITSHVLMLWKPYPSIVEEYKGFSYSQALNALQNTSQPQSSWQIKILKVERETKQLFAFNFLVSWLTE